MIFLGDPPSCRSPHWCIMCKSGAESLDHVLIHCSIALSLWLHCLGRLF